jgi:trk system potassium uptake protein
MNVIVVGCGRLGSELASRLFHDGQHVTVVDSTEQSFERLEPDFRGRTVTGEALSKEVLDRAGADKADGLAAVTNSDTLNAVVAHTARTIYKIPHIVVRNYDPNLCPVLEAFGFQVVSSTAWGAQRIEEMLNDAPVQMVYSAGKGEVEVYRLIIPQILNGSPLGVLVSKSDQILPVAFTHANFSSLPTANTILETGDFLYISATAEGISTLRSRLAGKEA